MGGKYLLLFLCCDNNAWKDSMFESSWGNVQMANEKLEISLPSLVLFRCLVFQKGIGQ
jgi:hypothetical protein